MNISDLHLLLGGELHGSSEDIEITDVAEWCHAKKTDAVFLFKPRSELRPTKAGVIVSSSLIQAFSQTQIIVDNPRLAMARLLQYFYPVFSEEPSQLSPRASIHDTAVIDPLASIGDFSVISDEVAIHENVSIGSNVFVGKGCVLHSGCRIHSNVVLYPNTHVGESAILHSGCIIGADGFGYEKDGLEWVKLVHIGGVRIGKRVEIGSLTTIDRGCLKDTQILDDVKIDNHVHIGHNSYIGQRSVIAGGSLLSGGVVIGDDCILAGDVSIKENVDIGKGVTILARSGVTKSIKSGSIVSGFPAQSVKKDQKYNATLRRLVRKSSMAK